MAIYSWFSHNKWWFSIVMLVYQRVNLGVADDSDIFLRKSMEIHYKYRVCSLFFFVIFSDSFSKSKHQENFDVMLSRAQHGASESMISWISFMVNPLWLRNLCDTGWWWLEHGFYDFPYLGGLSSSQLTNSLHHFSEGWRKTTNQDNRSQYLAICLFWWP